jgi:sec-independent protein translocase protein TatA
MASLLALPEGGEWIILLVVVVFLFGANKLPDLTRNAAKALVEFRKVTAKGEEVKEELAAELKKPEQAEPEQPKT